jgi:hypothetical protein
LNPGFACRPGVGVAYRFTWLAGDVKASYGSIPDATGERLLRSRAKLHVFSA